MMIGKDFILAGKAIFTLTVSHEFAVKHDCKDHYTFRVVRKAASEKWPEAYFVNVLMGPDNTRSYAPLGKLDPQTGLVSITKNSKFNDSSWPVKMVRRIFACVWELDGSKPENITVAGFELNHAGRCGRCGRLLTTPTSIKIGLGSICVNLI